MAKGALKDTQDSNHNLTIRNPRGSPQNPPRVRPPSWTHASFTEAITSNNPPSCPRPALT